MLKLFLPETHLIVELLRSFLANVDMFGESSLEFDQFLGKVGEGGAGVLADHVTDFIQIFFI